MTDKQLDSLKGIRNRAFANKTKTRILQSVLNMSASASKLPWDIMDANFDVTSLTSAQFREAMDLHMGVSKFFQAMERKGKVGRPPKPSPDEFHSYCLAEWKFKSIADEEEKMLPKAAAMIPTPAKVAVATKVVVKPKPAAVVIDPAIEAKAIQIVKELMAREGRLSVEKTTSATPCKPEAKKNSGSPLAKYRESHKKGGDRHLRMLVAALKAFPEDHGIFTEFSQTADLVKAAKLYRLKTSKLECSC